MDLCLANAADAATLAELHRACFTEAWGSEAVGDLLSSPGTFALLAEADGRARGFILIRVAGGEAEILTIAVHPSARRHGTGRRLLAEAAALAAKGGASALFLEAAVDNVAALGLYAVLGFAEVGRRRAYYARPAGPPADALILKVELPLPSSRLGAGAQPG